MDELFLIAIALLLLVAATICFQPEFFRRRHSAEKLKKKLRSKK